MLDCRILTAREEKAALRAEWASGTGNVSTLSKGSYTPHRVHWGYRADGTRVGSNFLYHPQTGLFVAGRGDSAVNWGLVQDSYTDSRVSSFSTSSSIPSTATNFTLALEVSAGQSQRSLSYTNTGIAVTAARAGYGTLTVTFDEARSVTLQSVAETGATAYFEAGRRVTRNLDISATDSISYTTAITLA